MFVRNRGIMEHMNESAEDRARCSATVGYFTRQGELLRQCTFEEGHDDAHLVYEDDERPFFFGNLND